MTRDSIYDPAGLKHFAFFKIPIPIIVYDKLIKQGISYHQQQVRHSWLWSPIDLCFFRRHSTTHVKVDIKINIQT